MMNSDFGRLIRTYRDQMQLTLDLLGGIVGLSKPYLNNLENSAKKKIKSTKDTASGFKHLSLEKLRYVILALSQNKLQKDQETFAKKNNESKIKVGHLKTYFNDANLPQPEELNLEKFRNLLFTSTGLTKYKDCFVPVQFNATIEKEVVEFVSSLSKQNATINSISHNFEIWTLTDIASENLIYDAARVTAQNILLYKIRYVNFIPIEDNLQWKVAYQNIQTNITEILKNANEELNKYWRENDHWTKYLQYYGVSQAAFFIRFRIYDPYSSSATGTYNVGGKSSEVIKFVEIPSTDIQLMIERLKFIIYADASNELKADSNYFLKELECTINKKEIK